MSEQYFIILSHYEDEEAGGVTLETSHTIDTN